MFHTPSPANATQSTWDHEPAVPPISLISFERLCLLASIFNALVASAVGTLGVINKDVHAGHAHILSFYLILFVFAFVLMFPFLGLPYWLGLAVSRARNFIASFFLYSYAVCIFVFALAAAGTRGFGSKDAICLLIELALMVAALVCLNRPDARAWRRSY